MQSTALSKESHAQICQIKQFVLYLSAVTSKQSWYSTTLDRSRQSCNVNLCEEVSDWLCSLLSIKGDINGSLFLQGKQCVHMPLDVDEDLMPFLIHYEKQRYCLNEMHDYSAMMLSSNKLERHSILLNLICSTSKPLYMVRGRMMSLSCSEIQKDSTWAWHQLSLFKIGFLSFEETV